MESAHSQVRGPLRTTDPLCDQTDYLKVLHTNYPCLVGFTEDIPMKVLKQVYKTDLPQTLGLQHLRKVDRAYRIGPQRHNTTKTSSGAVIT